MSSLPLVLQVVGLGLVLLGAGVGVTQSRRRAGWTRTSGEVARYDHGGENSLPVIRFTAADGQQVEGVQQGALDVGVYTTGGRVPVWYDPADPSRFTARVRGSHGAWVALVVAGGICLTAGTLVSRF